MTSVVGEGNPAHFTGVGKALLAEVLPDEAAVRIYVARDWPLEHRTTHTITDARALAADVAITRDRGYGLDREESEIGVVCVAFPVELGLSSLGPAAGSASALDFRTEVDELIEAAPEIKAIISRLDQGRAT